MAPGNLVTWALSVCLASGPAPTPDAGAPVHGVEARGHFDSGMAAWLAEDFAAAQRELESAYAIEPAPALLYALGQLERLQGRCDRAIERFEAYLATTPSPEAAEDTRVNILRCRAQLPPAPRVERAPVRSDPPPPPIERGPRIDALGVSLTTVGAVAAATGLGLFGGAFVERRRAADEFGVDAFERGVRRSRIEHATGLAIASVGAALLVGGIVRLVLVRRQQRRARR